jgi:hypothetical protein
VKKKTERRKGTGKHKSFYDLRAVQRITPWMMKHETLTIILSSIVGAILGQLLMEAICIVSGSR